MDGIEIMKKSCEYGPSAGQSADAKRRTERRRPGYRGQGRAYQPLQISRQNSCCESSGQCGTMTI